jgi:hypothetical protein
MSIVPPKHRWIILVGLALVSCGTVLLGLRWLYPAADGEPPAPVTSDRPADREPVPPKPAEIPATTPDNSSAAVLRGRVIDAATRRAIEEFEVRLLLLQHDLEVEPPPLTRTFQSATGHFEWKNAPVGIWQVTVAAADHQQFQIDTLTIAAGQETRDLLVPLLRGYKVSGRVFDQRSGAGIPDASIWYMEAGDLWHSRGGFRSRKDGTFTLEGVPRGSVTFGFQSQEHARRELDIVVSERTPPLEVALSRGGTISGFLVTAGGAPLVGPVTLVNEQNFSFRKRTDDTGAFSFGQLSPGHYRLGGGVDWQDIVLGPDERREDVFITAPMPSGRTVRGTVRGLRSEEAEHAFATLRSQTKGPIAMRPLDKEGTFILRGVPPGRADLGIDLGSGKRTLVRSVEIPADRDLIVDIDVPAGARVSGRVTQGGKPVAAGRSVSIAPAEGKHGSFHRARTSADGTYRVDGVPAGEYQINAELGEVRRVSILGDTVIDLDIPAVQLGGRVLEKAGTVPIVNATLFATPLKGAASGTRPATFSNHFGEFQLTGLTPGEVMLSAYKSGYELYRERIVYASPVTDLTIRLTPGTGIAVKVRVAQSDAAVRAIDVRELLPDGSLGVILQIRLDQDGSGSLPAELAGSTLEISGAGRTGLVRKWDGQPLDLQLR